MNFCHYPEPDPDEHDPDALAEFAAAQVGLDGLDVRDVLVFIRALVPSAQALPRGELTGCFDLETCTIRVDPTGTLWHIKTRLIHELGHIILWVNGIEGPHDEVLCDRVGRAGVIGRGQVVRKLRTMHVDQVVAEYKGVMSVGELLLRVGEVLRQEQRMRRVG